MHLEECDFERYECERCQTAVIRKLAVNHDCYNTLVTRLEKIDKAIVFVKERYSG